MNTLSLNSRFALIADIRAADAIGQDRQFLSKFRTPLMPWQPKNLLQLREMAFRATNGHATGK
jgi:hypothetical protein